MMFISLVIKIMIIEIIIKTTQHLNWYRGIKNRITNKINNNENIIYIQYMYMASFLILHILYLYDEIVKIGKIDFWCKWKTMRLKGRPDMHFKIFITIGSILKSRFKSYSNEGRRIFK